MLPTTSTSNPANGSTITCTWTTTRTYGSTYSNLSYPGLTNSSGTRWIYASIQTLQHSFWVQSYNQGSDLGTLAVRGSIAQKWRGAVGTSGGTGFDKELPVRPAPAVLRRRRTSRSGPMPPGPRR